MQQSDANFSIKVKNDSFLAYFVRHIKNVINTTQPCRNQF